MIQSQILTMRTFHMSIIYAIPRLSKIVINKLSRSKTQQENPSAFVVGTNRDVMFAPTKTSLIQVLLQKFRSCISYNSMVASNYRAHKNDRFYGNGNFCKVFTVVNVSSQSAATKKITVFFLDALNSQLVVFRVLTC